jgi:hypothetical protein
MKKETAKEKYVNGSLSRRKNGNYFLFRIFMLAISLFYFLFFAISVVADSEKEQGLLFYVSYDKSTRADFSSPGKPYGKDRNQRSRIVAGKFGKAMDINRGGWVEYARRGHIQELEGTISFWFKAKFFANEKPAKWRTFFRIDPGHFQFYKGGDFLIVKYNQFNYNIPGTVKANIAHLTPNEWHHLELCWGQSRIALFLDGKLAEAKDTQGFVPFKNDAVRINSNGDLIVDEVKIYDRPLKPLGDSYWMRNHKTVDLPEWTPKKVAVKRDADDPMANISKEHLIFYAPFDEGFDAVFAKGSPKIEIPAGAKLVKGKYGGALDSGAKPFLFKWKGNLDTKEGTLSFWFFSRFSTQMQQPARAVIFSIGGADFEICYWAGMVAMIRKDQKGRYTWAYISAGNKLKHNQWNHIVAQWKDGKFLLKLNGEVSAAKKLQSFEIPKIENATFNCGRTAVIDDLRIYDKALLPWIWGPIPFSTEATTPHFKWAKPYAGKRTRALVLTDVRFPVELAQRLDLDVDSVNTLFANYLHMEEYPGGKWGQDNMKEWITLKIEKDPWDVLVISRRCYGFLDKSVISLIKKRIEDGAGLVLIDAAAPKQLADLSPLCDPGEADKTNISKRMDHYITGGFDLSAAFVENIRGVKNAKGDVIAKTDKNTPVIAVRKFGKGRVVGFGWINPVPMISPYKSGEIAPDMPDANPDFPTFDFREDYYAMTIRAILWAARHESPVVFKSLKMTGNDLIIETSNQLAKLNAKADIRILDEYSNCIYNKRVPVSLSAGKNTNNISLPVDSIPGGANRVIVRLFSKNKVLDFGQAVINMPKLVSVESVKLPKYVYDAKEEIAVTASFAGKLSGAVAVAKLLDGRGRVVAIKKEPVLNAKASFKFDASKIIYTSVARITVDVVINGVRSDSLSQEFFVPKKGFWDDYTFSTPWVGPYSINHEDEAGRLAIKARMHSVITYCLPSNTKTNQPEVPKVTQAKYVRPFVDKGIDIIPQCIIPAEVRMHHDRARTQWSYLLINKPPEKRTKQDLIRLVCYNNPAFRKKTRDFARKGAKTFRKYGPRSYNLQDEIQYMSGRNNATYIDAPDCCFCKYCMEKMRNWLKNEYGSLEKLNNAWGTAFTTWESVEPDTFLEAKNKKRYVSWSDHRRFNDLSTLDLMIFAKQNLRKEDPEARTSIMGTYDAAAYSGMDWEEIYKTVDMSNGYSNSAIRGSLQGRIATEWSSTGINVPFVTGYNAAPHMQRYSVFSHALDGDMGASWWWSRMLWRADNSSHKWGKAAMAATKVMHDGLSRLTKITKSNPDKIAIHYSMPSHRLNYALTGGTEKYFRFNRAGWAWLLKECGLGYNILSSRQLECDRLRRENFRVFIMPSSMAMADKEIKAVIEFIKSGGIVLADYAPAIADSRLIPRQKAGFDELLGFSNIDKKLDFNADKTAFGLGIVEKGIAPWTIKKIGKGHLVFVNLDMSSYLLDKEKFCALRNSPGTEIPLKKKLLAVLGDLGIRPNHKIRTVDGKYVSRLSSHTWTDGDALYIGMVKAGNPQKAIYDKSGVFLGYKKQKKKKFDQVDLRVGIDNALHVYDSRSGKYMGKTKNIKTTIKECDMNFLACLPYKVVSLDVSTPDSVKQGEVLTCKVSALTEGGQKAGKHVIRLEWFAPDGQYLDYYSKNYVADGGKINIHINTAFNDIIGTHKLVLRDVATGIVRNIPVKITAR